MSFIVDWIKYVLVRPFQFGHELVCDNKTKLVSTSKTAFVVTLIASTIFLARITTVLVGQLSVNPTNPQLPSLLSFLRDFFVIYLGTFSATAISSKFIRSWKSGKDGATYGSNNNSNDEDDDDDSKDEDLKIPDTPISHERALSTKTIDFDEGA